MSGTRKLALWLVPVLVAASSLLLVTPALALPDQRVAYGFDAGTGTAIADASANGTTATATNATWTAAGRYGNALVFNGTSSRVRSDTDVALNSSFTFSGWIFNPSNQAYETIATVGANRNFFVNDGVLGYYDGATDLSFGAGLAVNTWHYVSLVSDGATIRAFLNGDPYGTTQNLATPAVTDALQVGAGISGPASADFFSGTLDEVRVYNRVLSAAEITTDMNAAVSDGGGGGGGDTTAPVLSGGQPGGTLPAGTTQANLAVTSNEPATCRYGATPGTAYAAMASTFTTTGGTAHGSTVTGLADGSSYTFYVRCQDVAGNANTADFAITFAVGAAGGSGWSSTTTLPQARSANGATYANGYLYLVGGIDAAGAVVPTVYYAPVNANGTVGTWNTTTALPAPTRSVRPVFYNGRLYVAGGGDGNNNSAAVYFAPVNANGTLGGWQATTALPQAQLSHSTLAANGYLYVIGGNPGSCITTVRYAVINANGTLGGWNTTSALPAARCAVVEAAATYNGYLYLVAGYDNNDLTSTVLYAQLNANGTLGGWQTNANPIGAAREYHAVEVVNGTMYVIGGQAALFGNVTTSVERATINANGSVGAFSAFGSLPAPRGYLATEAVNGYLYAIGGGTGLTGATAQSSVYYTAAGGGGPGPGDTTPPSVSVSSPGAGAGVSGTVSVTATASDNVGVAGVQFLLDGNTLGAEDTTAPYAVSWDSATASNGAHTITARARDAAGNQATSAGVNVTVSNTLSGPRLGYALNEGAGTTIEDATSNNIDATATNPVWTTTGRYGNAITFDGNTGRVRANTDITLTGAFTLETWVNNPTNQPYETIISVGQGRDVYLANGVLNFYDGAATNLSFGPALATNTWQHVAIVSDGTTVRAYVDGVQRGTTQNLALPAITGPVQLGAWIFGAGNVDYFSGTLDETRVYNRALTATEIQTDMATGL